MIISFMHAKAGGEFSSQLLINLLDQFLWCFCPFLPQKLLRAFLIKLRDTAGSKEKDLQE